jgi:pimeloyl-ACP methyl ester carboxylesterase
VFASQIQPAGSLEDWIAFDQLHCRTTTPENAVRFLEQFAAIDVRDEARTIQCPTLVLHSRHDQRVPYQSAQQVRAAIKGTRLVPLASPNHLLTADEPAWQVFLDEVDRFFGG